MDSTSSPDDGLFRELRAWLDGLEQADFDRLREQDIEHDSGVMSSIDAPGIAAFADDLSCAFGWAGTPDGDTEVVAGWIGIPGRVVAAFGGVDVADDVMEIVPLGSPSRLSGVRARWCIYSAASLTATIAIRTHDGVEWPLTPAGDQVYAVDLPSAYAVPVDGTRGFEFVVLASVVAAPRASDLIEVDTVDIFVRQWALELPEPADSGWRGRSPEPAQWLVRTLDAHRAAALGVDTTVRLRRTGTDVTVRVERVRPTAELEASVDGVTWVPLTVAGGTVLVAQFALDRDTIDLRLQLRAK